jgi:hypothetical protein
MNDALIARRTMDVGLAVPVHVANARAAEVITVTTQQPWILYEKNVQGEDCFHFHLVRS